MIYGIVHDIEIVFRRRVFVTKYDTNDDKEIVNGRVAIFPNCGLSAILGSGNKKVLNGATDMKVTAFPINSFEQIQ